MRIDIALLALDSLIIFTGGAVMVSNEGTKEMVGACLAGGGGGGVLGVLASVARNGNEFPSAKKMVVRAMTNMLSAWCLGPALGYYALSTDFAVINSMPQFIVFFTSSVLCGLFGVAMLLTGEAWLKIKSKRILEREKRPTTDPKRLP